MPTAAGILVLAASLAQASPPPLPQLAIETYPAAAREALSRVYRTAQAKPSDPAGVCALARMLHAWELWEPAHGAYARCQALSPRAFDARYLDALVLQRMARHPEAVARLREAVALDATYLPARLRLAESLFEAGDIDESRRMFETLIAEATAEPAAQLGLARIEAAAGRHEKALPHLQRAIELYPEFGSAYYALALSYRALGRPDEARRALAKHAEYGPRYPAADDPVRATLASLRDDGRANLQRGVKLSEAGDLAGAIAAHEAALARDPGLLQAHLNLIPLYGRAGDYAKAEAHYKAALALDRNLPDAHYDQGVLFGMQEKWDLAADAYRQALALNPAHTRARNNLGQILERSRQFDAAADMYRAAIDADPSFRLARFNLGRMLLALNRTDEAIAELGKLTEPRDAEAPRYLFALAAAHLRAGHKAEGIQWAEAARRLAIEHGQTELAAIIERDLAKIK